jgi:hypothetical protein
MEGGIVGHNIEKGSPNDHPSQILAAVTKNGNFFNCPLLL